MHLAAVVALGEHAMQRLALDLGDRVPHRDLDGADADRALAVPAGLLVPHHHGEDFLRIEIVAGLVEQRFRIGLQDARDESRAHLRAAGIAAGGVEGEARDRLAVADDVGDDRDHRCRHLGEIETGIAADSNSAGSRFRGYRRCASMPIRRSLLHFDVGVLTTLPHLAISALIQAANSSGVLAIGSRPNPIRRSLTSGSATMAATSRCQRSMIVLRRVGRQPGCPAWSRTPGPTRPLPPWSARPGIPRGAGRS